MLTTENKMDKAKKKNPQKTTTTKTKEYWIPVIVNYLVVGSFSLTRNEQRNV